jgi:hypothetical protein
MSSDLDSRCVPPNSFTSELITLHVLVLLRLRLHVASSTPRLPFIPSNPPTNISSARSAPPPRPRQLLVHPATGCTVLASHDQLSVHAVSATAPFSSSIHHAFMPQIDNSYARVLYFLAVCLVELASHCACVACSSASLMPRFWCNRAIAIRYITHVLPSWASASLPRVRAPLSHTPPPPTHHA